MQPSVTGYARYAGAVGALAATVAVGAVLTGNAASARADTGTANPHADGAAAAHLPDKPRTGVTGLRHGRPPASVDAAARNTHAHNESRPADNPNVSNRTARSSVAPTAVQRADPPSDVASFPVTSLRMTSASTGLGSRPAPMTMVSQLLGALGLTGRTSDVPTAPTTSPLAAAVLAAARREFEPDTDPGITVGNQPGAVAVSPNGTTAYVANAGDGTVSVINTATKTVTATIPVGNQPAGIAFSPNGSTVYVTDNGDNTVSVINTSTNTVISAIPVGGQPTGIVVSPTGSAVYVADGGSNTVSVINTATNTVTNTVAVQNFPNGIAVSPNGKAVYVANEFSNSVSVINTATNTVTATIPVGNTPFGVAITPNGNTVYVANNADNTVTVINTATNTVTDTVPLGNGDPLPEGVSVSPDGRTVYVANSGANTVTVINTATNAVTGAITVGTGPQSVAVSPDGNNVYAVGAGTNTLSDVEIGLPPASGGAPSGLSPIEVGRPGASTQPTSPAPAAEPPAQPDNPASDSSNSSSPATDSGPLGDADLGPDRLAAPLSAQLAAPLSVPQVPPPPNAPRRSALALPSAITDSIPSILDIVRHPARFFAALTAGMVWTLLLVLATYALQKTLASQYGRWNERVTRQLAGLPSGVRHVIGLLNGDGWVPVVGLIGINGAVLSLVDPHFGFTLTSLRLLASMTSASVFGIIVPCWLTIWLARRRWGIAVTLRGAAWGVVIGAVGVVTSRLMGFVPGLLTGQTYAFGQAESTDAQRTPVLRLRATLTLGCGGLCWILATVIPSSGGVLTLFTHDFAVAGTAVTVTSTLLDLIPLAFLPGAVLIRTARTSWAVLTVGTATAFAVIVLPQPKYWLYVGADVSRWLIISTLTIVVIIVALTLLHRRHTAPTTIQRPLDAA